MCVCLSVCVCMCVWCMCVVYVCVFVCACARVYPANAYVCDNLHILNTRHAMVMYMDVSMYI